jgi:flagellar hook-associated protein 1 FlgK
VSLLSSLNTGRSALNASSASIEVLSHNVANATTAGFSRQRLQLSASFAVNRSNLFLGQGVSMDGVVRIADSLLGNRLVHQSGFDAAANTLRDNLSIVETWFDETTGTSMAERLEGFFDSLTAATGDPSDDGYRAAVVESAGALARSVSDTADALSQAISEFDTSLGDTVETTNAALKALADINRAISETGGASADLLDERDRLVGQLAETLGATVSIENNGQATLFVGGQAVVNGEESRTLSLGTDSEGNTTVRVSAGGGYIDVTDYVGGKAGGLVEARTKTAGYLERVNEFAATFAQAVNDQLGAGFDTDGNAGDPLFVFDSADPARSLTLNADVDADPRLLAFAASSSAEAGDAGNLEALLALEGADLFDGRSASGFLGALTSDVASDTSEARSTADQSGALLTDLEALRQSISGVNLDEEAVRLIEVQSAYQAAAKVISTTDEMLQTLIQL